ncbi:hypothetical protein [Actinomarinicola tropica]|uniref:DUF3109 family protein n=1 Tax=Actinomarinicola tropica TaxID=2789776 RepID=A0A5Q2RML2_9ACTN|nr:hypothetical protein [Actinomarinicola tropica]QGG95327.1 hypothetical protein GH723_09580 [Actinomarinicola tropica]
MSILSGEIHEWVSFVDEHQDTWIFDLTFLTSPWTCIFGRGCPGILTEPAPELAQGCCSYGAHFTDSEDVAKVEAAAARLTPATWEHIDEARRQGGPLEEVDGTTVSLLVDDACIFLNGPDFPGGPGCALHRAALEHDERPLDWKPAVCWQVPLRLVTSTDENERTTYTLREWQRGDWGDGGYEFNWWCTDAPEAFVGHRPVYEEMRDEIIEMVGIELYARFVQYVEARGSSVAVPHPALKKRR